MPPSGFEDDWLDVFGETCARLAAPFADRAAVLWRAGFDEPTWARFEATCLDALAEGPGAARFVDAFRTTRQSLGDPASAPTVRRSEGRPDLPWTTLISPPEDAPREEPAPARPLDLIEAMTTLASSAEPSGVKRSG